MEWREIKVGMLVRIRDDMEGIYEHYRGKLARVIHLDKGWLMLELEGVDPKDYADLDRKPRTASPECLEHVGITERGGMVAKHKTFDRGDQTEDMEEM